MVFRNDGEAARQRARALEEQLQQKQQELDRAERELDRLQQASAPTEVAHAKPSPLEAVSHQLRPEAAYAKEPVLNPYLVGMAVLAGSVFGWFLLPGYAIDMGWSVGLGCGAVAALATARWQRRKGGDTTDQAALAALAFVFAGNLGMLALHAVNRLGDDSPAVSEVATVVSRRRSTKNRLAVMREGHTEVQSIHAVGAFDVGDTAYLVVRRGALGLEWMPHYASAHPPH